MLSGDTNLELVAERQANNGLKKILRIKLKITA